MMGQNGPRDLDVVSSIYRAHFGYADRSVLLCFHFRAVLLAKTLENVLELLFSPSTAIIFYDYRTEPSFVAVAPNSSAM